MDIQNVQKYSGKRVELILKNKFKYTTILPTITEFGFTIIDKYGRQVEIDCRSISAIVLNEDEVYDK